MVGKLAKWVLALLFTGLFIANLLDLMRDSNTWLEFLGPPLAGLGYVAANLLALRFPKVSGALVILATAVLGGGLFVKVVQNWRFFVENWPITLIVLYLPVMLLLWFGYQKLEQRWK